MSTFAMSKYTQPLKSFQFQHGASNRPNFFITLGRRYEQLLHSEKHYDVIFNVAGARIKCHKLILSTASPVFEAMLYGPLRETQQEIEIIDISEGIFKILVHYVYTGVVDYDQLTLEEIIELYYCADKYLINELIGDCLSGVTPKLRFSNILAALELSVCMGLTGLLEVLMSFFTRCCLCDPQYMAYIKNHYLHVSKDCIKAIIELNKDLQKQIYWFVYEWCQQECKKLGLKQSEKGVLINDLKLQEEQQCSELQLQKKFNTPCRSIERSYYKACRPFNIDFTEEHSQSWELWVRSNRFITLLGIVMHSRLTPTIGTFNTAGSAYNESLTIAIYVSNSQPVYSNGEDVDAVMEEQDKQTLIWQYCVPKQSTKYNCDLNINWQEGVTLSPDVNYKIRLIWPSEAHGAEYPRSLLSNVVDGIQFNDCNANFGSLVKGIQFLNLV